MRTGRQGFTLLEIVLALALLAGALAALGEVLRLARQNAENARNDTRAQVIASSIMAELLSGAREAVEVQGAQLPLADEGETTPWLHSIAILPTEFNELLMLEVRVEQQLPQRKQPTSFTLRRWVLHPDFVSELELAAQSAEQGVGSSGSF